MRLSCTNYRVIDAIHLIGELLESLNQSLSNLPYLKVIIVKSTESFYASCSHLYSCPDVSDQSFPSIPNAQQ